jgi:hypothetical protein
MPIGPFTLKKVSEEDKVFYTMTVFNMAYGSKVVYLKHICNCELVFVK